MKNILLLGGAGFIGSNLVQELLCRKDYNINVLELEFASVSRIEALPAKIFRGNISDTDLLESILLNEKIEIVIHLVSTIIPGSCYDDFKREFTDVIFPSIRLMEICCKKNVKFVYFSSGGTVYGDRTGEVIPFVEADEMAPISYYGWSKQMMENSILYMNRTQGLRYLILRPSNPYGHGQNLHGKQGFIAVALGKILAGEPITVWGDGSSIRDYIYIDDLCKAVVDLLGNEEVVNTTLNIGSSIGYSVNQILDVIKNVVSEPVEVEYVAARQADVSSMVLDTRKLRNLISFNPISIERGIDIFYNSLKNG
jgi:UDP-glucose 4-epimerase